MSANLSRGPLTKALLDALVAGTAKPVGDGVVPRGAGWSGQPNAPESAFVPYTVLVSMTASNSSGPLAMPQADWVLPYSVQAFGVRRDQAEWMADKARDVLGELKGQTLTLGSATYKVQQVRTESIGGVSRIDATDPAYWGQQDGISVWITKEF